MSDYKFDCPRCGQSLEAPEDMLGETIDCPSCNQSITIPAPQEPASPPPPIPKQTKQCPFCAEEILVSAVKCKHCGEFLDGRRKAAPAPPPPTPQRVKTAEDNVLTRNRGCGDILIYGPLILILIILFAVMGGC